MLILYRPDEHNFLFSGMLIKVSSFFAPFSLLGFILL